MKKWFYVTLIFFACIKSSEAQSYIALSFDDPATTPDPLLGWKKRNRQLLDALEKHQLSAFLFVCGHRVNDPNGKQVIESWNKAGHAIANHSWNHKYYPSKKVSCDFFKHELLKTDSLIKNYSNYKKFFRFPFLKEGDTEAKRDSMRVFMSRIGYRNGYVSIDASDWYIDQRIIDTLKKNPKADLTPFKLFYIQHITDRCRYYDSLGTALTGRKVKHVLLLHHNLVNALFLSDVITLLKQENWQFINTNDAYSDEVYTKQPLILPAGESILWALAKENGGFEHVLRYPAEDGEYEKKKLDGFLLLYRK